MDMTEAWVESDLVDLTGMYMTVLEQLPDNVLSAVLRRVVKEAVEPDSEPVAAFQSSL